MFFGTYHIQGVHFNPNSSIWRENCSSAGDDRLLPTNGSHQYPPYPTSQSSVYGFHYWNRRLQFKWERKSLTIFPRRGVAKYQDLGWFNTIHSHHEIILSFESLISLWLLQRCARELLDTALEAMTSISDVIDDSSVGERCYLNNK